MLKQLDPSLSRATGLIVKYKTNRFHVAVRLFSNRSQKTSKFDKNISDTLSYRLMCHFLFLPHFGVICDLLLNRRTATWNLFFKQTVSSAANQKTAFLIES